MNHFRPLSDSLIQKLKQCRMKELDAGDNPLRMDKMTYAISPLYKRGYIDIKKEIIGNKIFYFVVVTKKGLEYLERLYALSYTSKLNS